MLDRTHEGSAGGGTGPTSPNIPNQQTKLKLVSTDEALTTMSGFPWVDFVSGCLVFPVLLMSLEATRVNSININPAVELGFWMLSGIIGITFLSGFSPWCRIPGLKHSWSRSLMTGTWTGILIASLIWLLVPMDAPPNRLEYISNDISLLSYLFY